MTLPYSNIAIEYKEEKKMKKTISLILCLVLVLGLTACGASSGSTTAANLKGASPAAAEPMEYAEEAVMMEASLAEGGTGTTSNVLPENRKWIITVYMDAETEDLDAAIAGIDEHIAELGGYVEDQNVYNGSSYSARRYRNASLTVRIPAEKVDAFTEEVAGIANVISKEKNLEDITLTYTATESRMKALQTEEARLLELLAEAENMSDLLEIEARLTDVRYELEKVTSQLRLYNNQVDFATVHLNLNEVQEYTPVEEPTFLERIRTTFSDALEGLGDGIVNITVFLVGNSPYLLVYGILGTAIGLLLRRTARARKARKDKQA